MITKENIVQSGVLEKMQVIGSRDKEVELKFLLRKSVIVCDVDETDYPAMLKDQLKERQSDKNVTNLLAQTIYEILYGSIIAELLEIKTIVTADRGWRAGYLVDHRLKALLIKLGR